MMLHLLPLDLVISAVLILATIWVLLGGRH
jgi:hypothetical protein